MSILKSLENLERNMGITLRHVCIVTFEELSVGQRSFVGYNSFGEFFHSLIIP